MDSGEFSRQRVFDPIQRIIHWWLAITVMALVLLGWTAKLIEVGEFQRSLTTAHITLGFVLSFGIIARVVWGLVGPGHARFGALWTPIAIALRPAKEAKTTSEAFGHVAAGSVAYLSFYAMTIGVVLTGLLLAAMHYDQGPFAGALFDDLSWHDSSLWLHNLAFYGSTLFIVAHLVGMILHEEKVGAPVAQAMISGYQYRRIEKSEVDHE